MNPFPKSPNLSQSEASQQEQFLELLKSNPELMKKYQEELTKMQLANGNKGKQSYQPLSSKEYLQHVKNKQIQRMLDEEGGLIILPEQGLVVKLFDKRTGQKIFVNIVKHEAVDHPEQKQLVDFQNQQGLRIPMSMGKIRQDFDKKGSACKVVDVVMNTKIVETAQKNDDIFQFMCQIIGNYLLQKYKIAVSDEKMVKVNIKYKGNSMQFQRIRAKKNANIQDVTANKPSKTKQQEQLQEKMLNQLSGVSQKNIISPDFIVYCYDEWGNKEEYSLENKSSTVSLQFEFDLSHLIHSKGIHLEGANHFLYLFVKGLYQICLKLPIQCKRFHGVFSRKDRKLRVECFQNNNEKINQTKQNKVVQVNNQKQAVNIEFQNDLLEELV